jgi:hypothetical protein
MDIDSDSRAPAVATKRSDALRRLIALWKGTRDDGANND